MLSNRVRELTYPKGEYRPSHQNQHVSLIHRGGRLVGDVSTAVPSKDAEIECLTDNGEKLYRSGPFETPPFDVASLAGDKVDRMLAAKAV